MSNQPSDYKTLTEDQAVEFFRLLISASTDQVSEPETKARLMKGMQDSMDFLTDPEDVRWSNFLFGYFVGRQHALEGIIRELVRAKMTVALPAKDSAHPFVT